MKKIELSKGDKILLVLYNISKKEKKLLKFEDVVVSLYKKFPDDFHLKGYKEYPDADSIRRPLYKLREQGLLTARNMIFSLTDKGLDQAKKIKDLSKKKDIESNDILDRYVDKEIRRIKKLTCFNLFLSERLEEINDSDFYNYIGVSVRTKKNEFISRYVTLSKMMEDIQKSTKNNALYKEIYLFHKYMISKFNDIIKFNQ